MWQPAFCSRSKCFFVHAAGAESIEDDVHRDPASDRALERVGELVGDASVVVDVGLEADAFFGLVDRLKHGRKDLITVDQDVVRIAIDKVGSDERCQILGGGWISAEIALRSSTVSWSCAIASTAVTMAATSTIFRKSSIRGCRA